MALGPRARVLLIAGLLLAALGALVWYLTANYSTRPVTPIEPPRPGAPSDVPSPTETPTPEPTPEPTPQASPMGSPPESPEPTPYASPRPTPPPPISSASPPRLLIPVAGVKPEQLRDTYTDSRSEGRPHNAIDIEAPRGTPVLAAADGRILRLFKSVKGGLTVYQLGTDERTVFYYAHLDRYADGLAEGNFARRGDTIAYVGDTGNATPGNYHLHFQVYSVKDPKHFWDGENLNPYTLLK
ncbi:MAG TPA: M23 family metallopeptidase [Pyrinomonadaceae bacterium]|nr:M23 family metallopeptidase [Pyrinomonadaceae bacterium]